MCLELFAPHLWCSNHPPSEELALWTLIHGEETRWPELSPQPVHLQAWKQGKLSSCSSLVFDGTLQPWQWGFTAPSLVLTGCRGWSSVPSVNIHLLGIYKWDLTGKVVLADVNSVKARDEIIPWRAGVS